MARFLSREKFDAPICSRVSLTNSFQLSPGVRLPQNLAFLTGSKLDNEKINEILESLILYFFRDLMGG